MIKVYIHFEGGNLRDIYLRNSKQFDGGIEFTIIDEDVRSIGENPISYIQPTDITDENLVELLTEEGC